MPNRPSDERDLAMLKLIPLVVLVDEQAEDLGLARRQADLLDCADLLVRLERHTRVGLRYHDAEGREGTLAAAGALAARARTADGWRLNGPRRVRLVAGDGAQLDQRLTLVGPGRAAGPFPEPVRDQLRSRRPGRTRTDLR